MTERAKDAMIKFKSTKKVVSKNGADGLQLSMAIDQVESLITELTKLRDNERGVKLSVYVSKKQTDGGREFDSGIAFVSAIQEFGTFKKSGTGGTPTKFKPKTTGNADVEAKIKKLTNEL